MRILLILITSIHVFAQEPFIGTVDPTGYGCNIYKENTDEAVLSEENSGPKSKVQIKINGRVLSLSKNEESRWPVKKGQSSKLEYTATGTKLLLKVTKTVQCKLGQECMGEVYSGSLNITSGNKTENLNVVARCGS